MRDSKIVLVFVGVSAAIWLLIALSIFLLPKVGYGAFVELALKAHPTVFIMAFLPLTLIYVRTADRPIPYRRALRLSVISLMFLLPLAVLSDSLNANALILTLGISDLIQEGERNYIIFNPRSLFITVFGTLLAMGYIFPAQVKKRMGGSHT